MANQKTAYLEQVKADAHRITLLRVRDKRLKNGEELNDRTKAMLAELEGKKPDSEPAEDDEYTVHTLVSGRIQYRKNGKLVSKAEYDAAQE